MAPNVTIFEPSVEDGLSLISKLMERENIPERRKDIWRNFRTLIFIRCIFGHKLSEEKGCIENKVVKENKWSGLGSRRKP